MAKKPNGYFAGKKLMLRRQKYRYNDDRFIKRIYKIKEKVDPLEGAPQARGIVLQKIEIEARQPCSGLRKAVKVQLIKNKRMITAFLPGDRATKFVNEHDEVLVECIGGKQGRAMGDIPGVRWKVIKVNDQSLEALRRGKIQKARK
ncbi:MAG: 30S ribosomal protein S12 [Candidatus Woesearchaeota archaeon]